MLIGNLTESAFPHLLKATTVNVSTPVLAKVKSTSTVSIVVAPIIEDGVAVCSPVASANVWEYLLYQTGMEALPNIPYIFSFRAWSDADRSIGVTFQDSPENKYNRYGSSNDPEANYGGSDWTLNISSTPTTYTFHVIFDKMVPTTVQYLQFMLNASSDVVYIDDVSLTQVSCILLPVEFLEFSAVQYNNSVELK